MTAREPFNARTAGDILVWGPLPIGDTPVVWKYVCPVDDHVVVSAVRLGYGTTRDSTGYVTGLTTQVDTTPVCPLHDATLESAKQIDVS